MVLPFAFFKCQKPLFLPLQSQQKPHVWHLQRAMPVSKHAHTLAPWRCYALASHCCSLLRQDVILKVCASLHCVLCSVFSLFQGHYTAAEESNFCERILLHQGKSHPSQFRPVTHTVRQALLGRLVRALAPAGGVKAVVGDHNLFRQHIVLKCDPFCV